jgi:universal stress protein E
MPLWRGVQGNGEVENAMNTNQKILVVVEPDYEPMLVTERAAWLAKLTQCDVQLLLCDPTANPLPIGIIPSGKTSELERVIRLVQEELANKLVAKVRESGVDVTIEIVEERPIAEAVLERAEVCKPKFVMKGTKYHSEAQRSMFVDTDWHLARACPWPLWFVKAGEFEESPLIVAAVDPMHSHDKPAALDDTITQMAKTVAVSAGGSVHLFHTYERLSGIGAQAIKTFEPVKLEVDKIDQKIKKKHRDALVALAKRNDIADENIHQLPGHTRDLLPSFVRGKNAQLVVMGALSRWSVKRMVIGSTAERVMDHLPCDILIVRQA